MYKEFYSFKEYPFSITADPDYFFSSEHHVEAYSHLNYGIKERKGIIVITGEIGTGKTTLCRMILSRLDSKTKTALILNPSFSDVQLLKIIVKDLGIPGNYRNKFELVDALNRFLIEETAKGHNVVLIIYEAQNLRVKQLEQIRLLSNLETEKEKLLQIVLVGQPELNDMLSLPSLRQLTQRVAVRYHMRPLQRNELDHYIKHRLVVAKKENGETKGEVQFTDSAVESIFNYSKGTPRMINILCDRALLAGFTEEVFTINEQIIQRCAEEVNRYEYHQ